jgi:Tol biopolymer transport system component
MTWRTITTEHFNIHFHQGEEALAEELSTVAEDVYDTMTVEMQWAPGDKRARRASGEAGAEDAIPWGSPGRIEVVLVDRTDYANGYASTLPYNMIVLFATAPTDSSTLNLYEHWMTALFTHELTHILHIDSNHGIVRATRGLIGRVASTNDLSPWWMTEGLATLQETRHSTGGRGRASWPDMIKRTAVVQDAFPPLGNLDGLQPYPPGGNLRYLFGQDFMQYIADTHGEDVWTRWAHLYGSGFPYVFATPTVNKNKPVWAARRTFGEPFVPMYFAWRDHLTDKYTAQAEAVRAQGETRSRMISGGDMDCAAPSFSPDGERLVWSCYDLQTGSAIWSSDGEGFAREVLLPNRGAGNFTWRSDSLAFAYAGIHIVNQFNTWSDINLYTLGAGSKSLTSGARARDPEFSPDGSRLLYVTNRAQDNQLGQMTVDQQRRVLTENSDHTQYNTPRFAPDGNSVAISIWRDGRRDLWLTTPEGKPLRRLTADAAIDASPAWSADGKWLFFDSDRTGIPNIWAIEIETEALFQVTNVVTGAVRPTVHPDGTRIAYQVYSDNGWDIHVLDLDTDAFISHGHLTPPIRWDAPLATLIGPPAPRPDNDVAQLWTDVESDGKSRALRGTIDIGLETLGFQNPPSETLDSFDDTEVDDLFGEELDYPFTIEPHRYNPLSTLLPRFISPYIQSTTQPPGPTFSKLPLPWGLQGSLSTSATDPLRHFLWSGWATYRTDAEAFGGGGTFYINRFIPVYAVSASSRATYLGTVPIIDPDVPFNTSGELVVNSTDGPANWERRNALMLTASWPYRLRSSLFAGYTLETNTRLAELPDEVYAPDLPFAGRKGSVSAGYRFSWDEATALAISREDGRIFSLVGSLKHPSLGSRLTEIDGTYTPFTQLQLTSEIREYAVNPFIPNHVLAVRAATGVTFGANRFFGNYRLGGTFGDSAFYVTPDEFRMLRGYAFSADVGDLYWLGGAEYRFPLWHIHRGVGTIPVFARNVSGAFFIDSGNAFLSPAQLGRPGTPLEVAKAAISQPLVGVGGEVQLRTIVGWASSANGTLGYAVPLTLGGAPAGPNAGAAYFRLGGSF